MSAKFNFLTPFILIAAVLLMLSPYAAQAQTMLPAPFRITLDNIQPPTECTPYGWAVTYNRITSASLEQPQTSRDFFQYVDGDLTASRVVDRHSPYVQDSWIAAGTQKEARFGASYVVPLWTESYEAATDEYISLGDDVLWRLRAALTCNAGEVTDFSFTSEAVEMKRDDLPQFERNLVIALEDIPLSSNALTQNGDLGMIHACQTFFIGATWTPRASISEWTTESSTGHDLLLFGSEWLPLLDVAEDYGQPGGHPALEQCTRG